MDGNADVYACQRAGDGGGRKRGESKFDAEEFEEFGGKKDGDAERIGFADDTEGSWDFAWKMIMGGPYPLHPFPVRGEGEFLGVGASPQWPRLMPGSA